MRCHYVVGESYLSFSNKFACLTLFCFGWFGFIRIIRLHDNFVIVGALHVSTEVLTGRFCIVALVAFEMYNFDML